MTNPNYSSLAELQIRSAILSVYQTTGEAGVLALTHLVSVVRDIYKQRPADFMPNQILVIKPLRPEEMPNDADFVDIEDLTLINSLSSSFTVGLLTNGRFRVWKRIVMHEDAIGLVSYVLDGQYERFWLGVSWYDLPHVLSGHRSSFSIPVHSKVDSALDDYARRMIQKSTCEYFSSSWQDPAKRMFFTGAPEHIMRDSLYRYFRAVFRSEIEVQREQNVDATQPIDLRLTWTFSPVRILIEIKWLGKSRDAGGNVTADYFDARARDGAKQLFDYLVTYAEGFPDALIRGYLVIIDGRRRGLSASTLEVSDQNAWYYKDREIVFTEKFEQMTDMYMPPRRMFAEPPL